MYFRILNKGKLTFYNVLLNNHMVHFFRIQEMSSISVHYMGENILFNSHGFSRFNLQTSASIYRP